MKSIKQIKKELHEYIDSTSDEKELMEIYKNTLMYLKSDKANENDPISHDQCNTINEMINNGSSDKSKSDKESEKSIERWYNDGGKNPS